LSVKVISLKNATRQMSKIPENGVRSVSGYGMSDLYLTISTWQ